MNIVLLVIDALRADHLSAYGYSRDTSPHLRRLAEQGVRFEQFFAHGNATHPSFTTLMTGRHPLDHGVVGHLGRRVLDPRIPTLAEALQAGGFATAAVDNMRRWFKRGFDVYRPYRFDQRMTTPMYTGEEVNTLALPLLDDLSRAGRPFFLFVHYWDPHSPYLPPAPYDGLFQPTQGSDGAYEDDEGAIERAYRFAPLAGYLQRWIGDAPDVATVVARYDGEVAYVDMCIGRLLARLDDLGLRDETLVVVTSDHGESLGEHDIYFDHHGLYDAQLHVPLLMHCPGLVPAGTAVDGLARHIDLAPTLLDFVGLPHAIPCQGVSLRGRIEGDAGPATETLLACELTWQSKVALRRPDWKLISARLPDEYGNPPLELYDLAADPREKRNLAPQRPDVARQLLAHLEDMVSHELALGGHGVNPMNDGVTLRPIFATVSEDALREEVIDHLAQQGQLPAVGREVYTAEEEAIIAERLVNLGYL